MNERPRVLKYRIQRLQFLRGCTDSLTTSFDLQTSFVKRKASSSAPCVPASPGETSAIMVVLYQSQTYPINPPNASPILTVSEVWEVMQIKCRKPELFIASMSACEVLEEKDSFMKRAVTFKEGMGPPGGKVVEDLDIHAPWKVLSESQNDCLYKLLAMH